VVTAAAPAEIPNSIASRRELPRARLSTRPAIILSPAPTLLFMATVGARKHSKASRKGISRRQHGPGGSQGQHKNFAAAGLYDVSSDYIGNYASAIVDAALTNVMRGTLVKVMAWYDNKMGFAHRMLDVMAYIAKRL
jgi:hypothetical protein